MSNIQTKYSGIEWIGIIPEHWEISSIKHMTKTVSIKNKSDSKLLSVYRDYGVIPKDSRDDNHNRDGNDLNSYKYVKPGYLVINKMKAWQGSLGVSNYHGIVSPAYITCKVNNKIEKEYLHYLLRNKKHVQYYNSISYGVRVDQWDMRYDDFKYIPILVPPKQEQTAIANYLDYHTSKIDKEISLLEQKVEKLDEYKQALIYETVTKGLDKNVPMKESGIEWIGNIPEHWEVKRVKDVCFSLGGGNYGEDEEKQGLLFPCISISDFKNGNLSDTNNIKMNRSYPKEHIIQKGSILIEKSGGGEKIPVGRIIYVKNNILAYYTNFVQGIKTKENSNFIHYCFNIIHKLRLHMTFVKQNTGLQNFDYTKFSNNFFFPMPLKNEQQKIAEYLEIQCKKIDKNKKLINKKIELIKEYKQSLIYEAVTGKINIGENYGAN